MLKVFSVLLAFLNFLSPAKEPKPSEIVYSFAGRFAKQVEKKYGLQTIGSGGAFPDKLEYVSTHFISNEHLSVDEVRKLIVAISDDFVAELNQCDAIKPFLKNYPADYQNIQIMISFQSKRGIRPSPPYVAFSYIFGGKISYAFFDNKKSEFIDEMSRKEPFEEAKEILNNKNGSK